MGGSAVAGTMALSACAPTDANYAAAVRKTWQPFKHASSGELALARELVRYATLAPSSHNTQCWTFKLEADQITVGPDRKRRTPLIDPDDHHLFVSLGCAVENLVQAALAHGYRSDVRFDAAAGGVVRISLTTARANLSHLYNAITLRQCARTAYDGKAVALSDLRELSAAARGDGVALLVLTEPTQLHRVATYALAANAAQTENPAFRAELLTWIRFNDADAVATGDGLLSSASGNPTAPRWLGSVMYRFFYTAKSENAKLAALLQSSSGIAVFSADVSNPQHWVEVGRSYERFALQAAALGINTAMANQAVEVATVRRPFAEAIGLKRRRPDLIVRFGSGPTLPRSLRRPIGDVILTS